MVSSDWFALLVLLLYAEEITGTFVLLVCFLLVAAPAAEKTEKEKGLQRARLMMFILMMTTSEHGNHENMNIRAEKRKRLVEEASTNILLSFLHIVFSHMMNANQIVSLRVHLHVLMPTRNVIGYQFNYDRI